MYPASEELEKKWWHRLIKVLVIVSSIIVCILGLWGIVGSKPWCESRLVYFRYEYYDCVHYLRFIGQLFLLLLFAIAWFSFWWFLIYKLVILYIIYGSKRKERHIE